MKLFSLVTVTISAAAQCASAITLTVSQTGGNASSPLLYGMMFEDINHSGDGGIHGQMLRNNGFQGDNPGLDFYDAVGSATISRDTLNPLTGSIHASIAIQPKANATGNIGFSNAGYFGMKINNDKYANYFFVKGAYSGTVTVSIVGASSGEVYGSTDVQINSNADSFTYYQTSIQATSAPDGNNIWQFTFPAAAAPNGLNVGLPQLYPTTFANRFNGLNPDIGQAMDDLKGSFLRFPGGNNLEGASFANRWTWNETIGLLEDRPGRQGDWGYPNTDALGLIEYLFWCQDMNLTPVLAIWAGLTLGGGVVDPSNIQPYVQDALNELEYLMGDQTTKYGALRISHGYSDPFPINYVEIGNEDFLNNGQASYPDRFNAFYNGIKAVYPNMNFIATTGKENGQAFPIDKGVITDVHYYLQPDEFVAMFNQFDNYDRDYPIFVGEYASTTDNSGNTQFFTTMQSSTSEAVYMIGMERNSDVVKMASFAPVLERYEDAQWHPNLFGYDVTNGVTRSTSYYVQKLFSNNRGDTILPVTSDTGLGPVYWVASSKGSTTFVKLANYGDAQQSVTVKIDGKNGAVLTQLSGNATQSNLPGKEVVVPQESNVSGAGVFTITLPAWSVSVLAAT